MTNLLKKAQRLASVDMAEPQRIAVYGDGAVGKTTLVAQLAKEYKLHWFDLDGGSNTIFNAIPAEYWGNIELYECTDLPDNPRAVKLIDKVIRPMKDKEAVWISPDGDYSLTPKPEWERFSTSTLTPRDIVVVDSATILSNSAMNKGLGGVLEAELAFAKKEFDHFGKQGFYLSNILLRMKQLPCHVIFIFHEAVLENLNGTKNIAPMFGTRNFAKTIIKDFNHILYLYKKNNKHCITSSTTHSANVQARSSTGVNVQSLEDIFSLFGKERLKQALSGTSTKVEFSSSSTPSDVVSQDAPATAEESKK